MSKKFRRYILNYEITFIKSTMENQGSNLRKNFAFPSEKLAKNLLVRTNLNFSNFLMSKWNLSKDLKMNIL